MRLSVRALSSIAFALTIAAAPFPASAQKDEPHSTVGASTEIGKDIPPKVFSGDRSREIFFAQVLLDRGHHSPGVIDGYGGGNTRRAIKSFERANDMKVDGKIDDELIKTLSDQKRGTVLSSYSITSEDEAGPFKPVPAGMAAMAKRTRLGFASIEEMLGEKFHMTPALLRALNPGAKFKSGASITVVNRGDETVLGSVTRIEVDKAKSEMRAYDDNDKVIATYPATVGSKDFPSPSGTMKVAAIAATPNYTFDPSDQEWGGEKTLTLPPGPNNPVGGTWIDLGKNGYGIHGSPDPGDIGKTASHGCVRLTNWDAAELAKAVIPRETQVVFK